MGLLNIIFFIIVNFFLFKFYNSLNSLKFKIGFILIIIIFLLFLNIIYDLLFFHAFFIEKKLFIVLLFLSLSPIILDLIFIRNIRKFINSKEFLVGIFIIMTFVQILTIIEN